MLFREVCRVLTTCRCPLDLVVVGRGQSQEVAMRAYVM